MRTSRVAALGVAAGLCLATALAAPVAATAATELAPLHNGDSKQRTGSYVVVLKDGAARDQAVERARRAGVEVESTFSHVLSGYAAKLTADEVALLRADPAVEYVQADLRIKALADGPTGVTSGRHATGENWALDRIDQRDLPHDGHFGYDNDGSGSTIFVLDSGLRTSHAQFGGRAENLLQDVPDVCAGHGTAVASAAAGADTGVAPGATIKGIRVLGCGEGEDAVGSTLTAVEALEWVGANAPAASVANLSLSTGEGFVAITDAVEGLIDAGVTVVVAAGNDGKSRCNNAFASPRSIVVGGTNRYDRRVTSSNFGCVGIWAPGEDVQIASSKSDSAMGFSGGTSLAAPYVSGWIARHLQAHPQDTPAQVRQALDRSATVGKLWDIGTVAPNRLLFAEPGDGAVDTVAPTAPGTPTVTGTRYDSLALSWPAASDDVRAAAYEVESANGDEPFAVATTTGVTTTRLTDLTPDTTYRVRVRARDTAGNWSAFSAVLEATTASSDTRAPSVPAPSAGSLTASSFTLQWPAATDGEDGSGVAEYQVQQGNRFGDFTDLGTTDSLNWKLADLNPQTTYWFRVRARDTAGNWSAYSSTVTVTTPAARNACEVRYYVSRTSETEFSGFANITNKGTVPVPGGWTLTFDLPEGQTFVSSRIGTATAAGQSVTVTGPATPIAVNAPATAWITGTGAGTAEPTAFTLNGQSCTVL